MRILKVMIDKLAMILTTMTCGYTTVSLKMIFLMSSQDIVRQFMNLVINIPTQLNIMIKRELLIQEKKKILKLVNMLKIV